MKKPFVVGFGISLIRFVARIFASRPLPFNRLSHDF